MGFTLYLRNGDKDACTLWVKAPHKMRQTFCTQEEAEAAVAHLDTCRPGIKHYVEVNCREERV